MFEPPRHERPLGAREARAPGEAELARVPLLALTLQRVSAALASSLDRKQVLEAIVRTCLDSLGAVAGAVTELSPSDAELRLVCAVGYSAQTLDRFAAIPVGAGTPLDRIVREREPLMIGAHQELAESIFPGLTAFLPPGAARAALPLATAEDFLGVLVLDFERSHAFSLDERDFLLAVAQQCAVAMERARFFEREHQARSEAEAANARLSEVLERMTDLHFVCDREWRYVRINRAMREFLREWGYEANDLLGRVIWQVFPRLVGGDMHRAMMNAAAGGGSTAFTAEGRYAASWYEGHAYQLQDGIAVHAHDMTERRRAEVAVARLTTTLRERVEEMETLLRVIPVGIGIASDPECREIIANPALAQTLGIATGTNASKSAPDSGELPFRIVRDGRELSADELPLQLAASESAPVWNQEMELLRADGSRSTLLTSAAPIFDDRGCVRGSVGVFVDITARKRGEIATKLLSEASDTFSAALDVDRTFSLLAQQVVPDIADVCVIFVVREDGSVGVVAMTATDHTVLAALRRFDRVHPVDGNPSHPVRRTLDTGRSILIPDLDRESLLRELSGDPSVLSLARTTETTSLLLVPIMARGEVLGAVGLGTRGLRRRFDEGDLALTEEISRRAGLALDNARLLAAEHRARSEAETARVTAERASRTKSDFLAMMSHELRTPLNAIAGYAELMELGIRGPVTEQQVTDLQKIRQNQQHLLGLINSVLGFARLDVGRVAYDLTNVPLDASLRAVESLIGPQVQRGGIVYECAACPPQVAVRADGEKVQQVLLNLLGNAVKFTPPGGRIDVWCDVHSQHVDIHVRDTGIGIAVEQLETIFEPFVQVSRTLSNPAEGVGLGLAISRELTRGMGGELTVTSALHVGSTFTLTLPRTSDRPSPA